MRGFLFTDEALNISGDTFYARLYPRVQSQRELFEALHYSCWFPENFGSTWNALDELVSGYDWIRENNIVVRHGSLQWLQDKDIYTYISILVSSFISFGDDDKNICYVFAESDKKKVIDLIYADERIKDAGRLILN